MRAEHEAAFEHFVARRSDDLMRLAVLLAADRGHAEDLASWPRRLRNGASASAGQPAASSPR